MRGTFFTALLVLAGCAGVEEPVAVTRQAATISFGDGGVAVKGTTLLAHLGATMASCPGGGYVAGAPGDDSVWLSPVQAQLAPARLSVVEVTPFPVACLDASPDGLRVLVGGPSSAYSLRPDGGVLVASQRVDAFDAHRGRGSLLAVGRTTPGTISLFPYGSSSLTSPLFSTMGVPGNGASLAWNQTGALLAGNPQARTAGLYLSMDGGLSAPIALANPDTSTTSEFGRVVATGDVTPHSSEEHLVAAPNPGRVYIFSGVDLVMTLQGGPTFGAALVVEPRDLGGGLHAIWVGEPGANRVHRFIGTEGQSFDAPAAAGNNSSFGASLAVDSTGGLAIGAPKYSEGLLLERGAVFEANVDAGTLVGQVMHCDAGQDCELPDCTTGTCLGAVFCERVRAVGSDCSPTQHCVTNTCVDGGDPNVNPDAGAGAGTPDAGGDAGTDAGSTDAGGSDAGITDAGITDAGITDAGITDAGGSDAGGRDAGAPDAGPTDAGEKADAGAGSDAGVDALVFGTSSCGCGAVELPLLVLALGLALGRRKRR